MGGAAGAGTPISAAANGTVTARGPPAPYSSCARNLLTMLRGVRPTANSCALFPPVGLFLVVLPAWGLITNRVRCIPPGAWCGLLVRPSLLLRTLLGGLWRGQRFFYLKLSFDFFSHKIIMSATLILHEGSNLHTTPKKLRDKKDRYTNWNHAYVFRTVHSLTLRVPSSRFSRDHFTWHLIKKKTRSTARIRTGVKRKTVAAQ